jgi:hypothetical protein
MTAIEFLQKLYRTAVHEAGHALIAHVCDIRFDYVTLEPLVAPVEEYVPRGGAPLGGVALGAAGLANPGDHDRYLLTLWAGAMAEMEVFRPLNDQESVGFVHDAKQIDQILDRLVLVGGDRDGINRDVCTRVRATLRAQRPTLVRIADQLMEQNRLTYAEVAELVRDGA